MPEWLATTRLWFESWEKPLHQMMLWDGVSPNFFSYNPGKWDNDFKRKIGSRMFNQ
jgi:hypothetical protein